MDARSHSHKNRHDRTGPSRSDDHRQPSPPSKEKTYKQHRRRRGQHHSSRGRHPHYSSNSSSHSRIKASPSTLSRNPSTATPVPLVQHPPRLPPIPLVPEPSSSFNSPLSPSPSALPRLSTTLADVTTSPPSTSLSSSGSFATTFVPLTASSPTESGTYIVGGPLPGPPTDLAKVSGSSSSTNMGIVLGIVIGGLALMGLAAVLWFRHRDRHRNRKELVQQQQDSEIGIVAMRGGGAGGAVGRNGASTGTGTAGLVTESSLPMTSYRHEAFMTLVKEAAMGFYAPSLDHPPLAACSLSTENPAVGASTAIDKSQLLANGGRGSKAEGEEIVHKEEGSRQVSIDDGSEEELQYLDVGSPRPPRRILS